MYHKPIWHLPENIKQLGAVSRPLSSHCFHGGKKYLELSDRNAVAGQHSQQLHQQVGYDLERLWRTVLAGRAGGHSELPVERWAVCWGDVRSDRSECRPADSGWTFSEWQWTRTRSQPAHIHQLYFYRANGGFYLESIRTVVQQLQHVANVLRVLNNKIELHIKLSSNQLEKSINFPGKKWKSKLTKCRTASTTSLFLTCFTSNSPIRTPNLRLSLMFIMTTSWGLLTSASVTSWGRLAAPPSGTEVGGLGSSMVVCINLSIPWSWYTSAKIIKVQTVQLVLII